MSKDTKPNYIDTILATAVGGVLLLLATIFMTSFISSPPTRAEFDALKVETTLQYKNINGTLKELKTGQTKLIDHLLKGVKK